MSKNGNVAENTQVQNQVTMSKGSSISDKNYVQDKVIEIIAQQLGMSEDQIKLESRFSDDLSSDSLDHVEMMMRFEEEFDISISEDVAEKITTVEDIVKYIESQK